MERERRCFGIQYLLHLLNPKINFRYVRISNLNVECSFHRRIPAPAQRGRGAGARLSLGQERALL